MIDARRFIRERLLTVCDNVKMSRPDGDVSLPLICYAEAENIPPSSSMSGLYTRLGWRIGCYAGSFTELAELVTDVDSVMSGLGFSRTSKTSDDQARIGTDLYLCRLSYSALVNEETLEILAKS
jgi:hypothetical protein